MIWKPGQELNDERFLALIMAWRLQAVQHEQKQVALPFWALDRLVNLAEKGAIG